MITIGTNPKLLKKIFKELTPESLSKIQKDEVIIDALLGTGLNRPVEGSLKELFKS